MFHKNTGCRKSPRFARRSPCAARTSGDFISFEAGCRPLELPLILKYLSPKKSLGQFKRRDEIVTPLFCAFGQGVTPRLPPPCHPTGPERTWSGSWGTLPPPPPAPPPPAAAPRTEALHSVEKPPPCPHVGAGRRFLYTGALRQNGAGPPESGGKAKQENGGA